jgi:RNA polymerase sigma-70 factor (ECF subfamily)
MAKVSSWVFKIAYNLSANELKRRKRLHDFHATMSAAGRGFHERWSADRTEAGNRESAERLLAAMSQLPENQRAALLLKINEGLTYLEISNVLDVSIASVESLIFRARSRLKQLVRASAGIPPESEADS